jgi:thiol-disulfide isomerase/thioredoxin
MFRTRFFNSPIVCPLAAIVVVAGFSSLAISAPNDEQASGTPEVVVTDGSAADAFAVPDGSPSELLTFIERIANPHRQFASNEELQKYLEGASTSIAAAADKILAAKATDRQTIDAIEWKVEAMRIQQSLGDQDAERKTDEFLRNLQKDERPAIVAAAAEVAKRRGQMKLQMQLASKSREWPRLSAEQKSEFTDHLISTIKSDGIDPGDTQLLMMYCDMLAMMGDYQLAARVTDDFLPLYRASKDPNIARQLPYVEGVNRRVHLPGNKLELEGTFLDGKPLDWNSYRGKVVLVDFWATQCGPCVAEVPNVLANYRNYHDKGFDVLAISLDSERGDVEAYMEQAGLPWSTLFYGEGNGWAHPMAEKYGISGIPTAILVDQQGNVVNMQARGPRLGEELRRLLGPPAAQDTSAVESSAEQKTAQNATHQGEPGFQGR